MDDWILDAKNSDQTMMSINESGEEIIIKFATLGPIKVPKWALIAAVLEMEIDQETLEKLTPEHLEKVKPLLGTFGHLACYEIEEERAERAGEKKECTHPEFKQNPFCEIGDDKEWYCTSCKNLFSSAEVRKIVDARETAQCKHEVLILSKPGDPGEGNYYCRDCGHEVQMPGGT